MLCFGLLRLPLTSMIEVTITAAKNDTYTTAPHVITLLEGLRTDGFAGNTIDLYDSHPRRARKNTTFT